MAAELARLGHEVLVVTETELGDRQELQDGYKIARKPSFTKLYRMARMADRLICKGGVSARFGLAAIMAKKPLVIVHEMTGTYFHYGLGFKLRLENRVRKRVFDYASEHIGVSEVCLRSKNIPDDRKKRVLYNAVVPELLAMANNTSPNRYFDIIYVGRLIVSKGIFVFSAALRRFEQAGIPLRVAIIGEGHAREALTREVEDLKGVRIQFTGELDGESLAKIYNQARIVVVPSTHPEGMGLVIAEAFAFGCPVVGSDLQVIQEVAGDAGIFFKNGDDQDLFEKLCGLLNDPQHYNMISEKARYRSKLFSIGAYRQKLTELVSEWGAQQ